MFTCSLYVYLKFIGHLVLSGFLPFEGKIKNFGVDMGKSSD